MTNLPDRLRVLIINDGGAWVAQCLEVDVAAQASNLDELRKRLDMTLKAELQDQSPESIGPAPKHFHDLWERAKPIADRDGSNPTSRLEMALAA